jgi:predicted secreted protein
MAYLKGSDMMVFATIGTELKSIAYATNHTLTIGTNTTEISTKDSGAGVWIEQQVQKLNWSITSENLFTFEGGGKGHSFEDLYNKMITREPLTLVFALENSVVKPDIVPSEGWSPTTKSRFAGSAYITDFSINAPDGDNVSASVTFSGTGSLTFTPAS